MSYSISICIDTAKTNIHDFENFINFIAENASGVSVTTLREGSSLKMFVHKPEVAKND